MSDSETSDLIGEERDPSWPDGPDFFRLSEIILRHDALTDGPEGFAAAFRKLLEEAGITEDALIHMAMQRSHRMMTDLLSDGEPLTQESLMAAVGTIFVDGFFAGVEYGRP